MLLPVKFNGLVIAVNQCAALWSSLVQWPYRERGAESVLQFELNSLFSKRGHCDGNKNF
jgi:hypothetical protein